VLQFGSWVSALALFVYAMAFSWAYVSLQAGTGALILFAAVQATMIAAALWSGERPGLLQWLGFAMAILGLLYLLLPGLAAPDPLGAALMFASGVAWGLYSLRGRGKGAPVAQTAGNFVRTVPFAVLAMGVAHGSLHAERPGVLLAITSGAVTSGLGYVLWYMVLPRLTVTRAAFIQLAVPLLAALGGVLFVAEPFTRRLAFSSVLILGGLALAIASAGVAAIPRPGPR
jgi:drug/metabolite transporter (DMT)-like permease